LHEEHEEERTKNTKESKGNFLVQSNSAPLRGSSSCSSWFSLLILAAKKNGPHKAAREVQLQRAS
jgi:hypothetical protein